MKKKIFDNYWKYLLLVTLSLNFYGKDIENFVNTEEHLDLTKEILKILEKEHYVKLSFNEIQENTLQTFIKALDPNHLIFLESEVNHFLDDDDQSIENTIKKSFSIFNLYHSRYTQRNHLQTNYIKGISNENLNQDREIKLIRKDDLRENDLQDLYNLWSDFILNDLIHLIVGGNNLEKAKEKLLKRQKSQINYFIKTRDEDVFDIFINSLTSQFGPATTYLSPKEAEDFDIDMKLSLEGIGAILSSDGIYTSIISIVPGGPADKSTLLHPKDKIIGVGQNNGEIEDIVGWRIDDAVRLIRGPKKSNVKLELIPANALDESETKIITIERDLVQLEDQSAKKKTINITKNEKDFLIGVITLPAFYMDFDAYQRREYNFKSSSSDVKKLIRELKNEGVDGLVLDLRNNGGGSLFEANSLAHLFLGAGQTVQVKNSIGDIQGLGRRRGFQFYDAPLVILVNQFSASASEILAGAIQDYKRGLILGSETFGKGTVQSIESLSLGELKYTEAKHYRVTGNSVQLKGVIPDIIIPNLLNATDFGMRTFDNALEFDQIRPIEHKNFNRVLNSKDQLLNATSQRVLTSPAFQYMSEEKDWRSLQKKKESLSLNLKTRINEKRISENLFLKRLNKYRKLSLLEEFGTYKEYMGSEENTLNLEDEILNEAANILVDSIELAFHPVIASNQVKIFK